jgi:hypothetical protein
LATLLIALPLTAAMAADHLEAPALMGQGDVDLADLYAFQSPTNPNNSVLILTVNPFAGQISGTGFSDTASYAFMIDNDGDAIADVTYNTRFSADVGGNQALTMTRTEGNNPSTLYASGITGQDIFAGQSMLRADLFDDPFFFDQAGFVATLQSGTLSFTGADAFAGTNASAIIIEVPLAAASAGSTTINLWATTGRI